jgi:predicted RNase H-like nuclease
VAGVDGARGGWAIAFLPLESNSPGAWLELHRSFASVRSIVDGNRAVVVGIDMPIGLASSRRRPSDSMARARLGQRRSSLFPTPAEAVLAATSHTEASEANRAAIGVGLSIQAWNLVPGIREVRAAIEPSEGHRFVECHPETSFVAMAGYPLSSKKTRVGVEERLEALRPHVVDTDAVLAKRPAGCGIDDVLDAMAAAWSARRLALGQAERLGEGTDEAGYSLSIVV